MKNIFWVIPKKLCGRAGHEVDPWNLEKIKESGIDVIVSTHSDCDELEIKNSQIEHLKHFMPTVYPTTQQLVDRFVLLTKAAADDVVLKMNEGKTVMVHCYAGRDRTGLVLAAVLMQIYNMDPDEALTHLRAVRPTALTSPGMLEVLAEYHLRFIG